MKHDKQKVIDFVEKMGFKFRGMDFGECYAFTHPLYDIAGYDYKMTVYFCKLAELVNVNFFDVGHIQIEYDKTKTEVELLETLFSKLIENYITARSVILDNHRPERKFSHPLYEELLMDTLEACQALELKVRSDRQLADTCRLTEILTKRVSA